MQETGCFLQRHILRLTKAPLYVAVKEMHAASGIKRLIGIMQT
jgi:hypothetical protein